MFTDEDVNGLEPTRPAPGPSLGGASSSMVVRWSLSHRALCSHQHTLRRQSPVIKGQSLALFKALEIGKEFAIDKLDEVFAR